MGYVDVSDQLRGSYCIDLWVRNRKWWWTMVFGGIGTLLTNAYVVYKKVNELEGVNPKHLLTHYEFLKDIALYWINPQRSRYNTASPATATCTTNMNVVEVRVQVPDHRQEGNNQDFYLHRPIVLCRL